MGVFVSVTVDVSDARLCATENDGVTVNDWPGKAVETGVGPIRVRIKLKQKTQASTAKTMTQMQQSRDATDGFGVTHGPFSARDVTRL